MGKFKKFIFKDGRSERMGTIIARDYSGALDSAKTELKFERPFLFKLRKHGRGA